MIPLLLHAGATLAMVGLIWFVQIVHYPLFDLASASRFASFSAEHQRRTSLVVMPLMITEAVAAIWLLVSPPLGLGRGLIWLGAALLVAVWLSTAFLQVPLHRRLSAGHDTAAIRRLVATNWLRTAGWTGRGLLALVLLEKAVTRG